MYTKEEMKNILDANPKIKKIVDMCDKAMAELCSKKQYLSGSYYYDDEKKRHLYEFSIACSVPDRNVEIGGIDLEKFDCLAYVDTSSTEFSCWPDESWVGDWFWKFIDKYNNNRKYKQEDIDELIRDALYSIFNDIEELIGFEEYVYECMKHDLNISE